MPFGRFRLKYEWFVYVHTDTLAHFSYNVFWMVKYVFKTNHKARIISIQVLYVPLRPQIDKRIVVVGFGKIRLMSFDVKFVGCLVVCVPDQIRATIRRSFLPFDVVVPFALLRATAIAFSGG